MSQKKIATYILDALIFIMVCVCLMLANDYVADKTTRNYIMIAGVAILLVLLIVELVFWAKAQKTTSGSVAVGNQVASALVLLGEGQRGISRWDLMGNTSILIGKTGPDSEADIDLRGTEYSSMLDDQHVMLNFTETGWYIEDLASRNGTAILRPGNEREQLLTPGMPCKIEPGDVLCLASDTKLAVK